MNETPVELERLQRWFQSVIKHPQNVRDGVADEYSQRQINVRPENIESVVTRSNALTAIERLAVYGNAYHARLSECLRIEFPALLCALGPDVFEVFANEYLQNHPSHSYTLSALGQNFPAYLARTLEQWDRPQDAEHEHWPEFVVDLATLERTFSEVFDGPGIEKSIVSNAARLTTLDDRQWRNARFDPAVCLRLDEFRFPVELYLTAARKRQGTTIPEPSRTFIAMTRKDYVVRMRAVSPEQFVMMRCLSQSQSVTEAIQAAAVCSQGHRVPTLDIATAWIADWVQAGFFLDVSSTDGGPSPTRELDML